VGIIADIRRARKLAGILEFPCPACRHVIPREKLQFHSRRAFCPDCGAVVLAPPGQPTGLVGPLPPEPDRARGVLASLGFFPAAAAGSLALYQLWMLPGAMTAAAVGYLGWRPIGWEATVMTSIAVVAAIVIALFAIGVGLSATRRMPGTLGTAAIIAVCLAPIGVGHAFVVMPWSARMLHTADWPAELALLDFRVCAATFELGSSALSAHGLVAFDVENRSSARVRRVTFTVKAGRSSDWFEQNANYRFTVPDVEPQARAHVEQRVSLGNIMWKGGTSYGGPGSAAASLVWDAVQFEDGRAIGLAPRPQAATVWPIPDCPGASRPEVPWYVPPSTGPR
jgi:hypothetical protein